MAVSALVERVDEIDELAAIVSQAGQGDGRVALIEGPAGIGKTRLLAELRARAAATGALTLTARSSELERAFPFGVVRQLFEGCVLDPARRAAALAGAAATASAVFAAPDDAADDDRGPDASFATLHGLYWLTLNLAAGAPLVLAVDDLHWCDRPSLRFVAYLVRRLEDQPVLLATTLRSADPGTDAALIAEIAHDPLTVTVRPRPFSPEGSAQLVRDRFDGDAPPELCSDCHAATGGNPLLLTQLLSALDSRDGLRAASSPGVIRSIGPRAVKRTVLLRLARLPPEALAVARVVAVLGDGAQLPAVARLAGLEERPVAEVAHLLARAEILRFDAPLGFVHPLVRDAVYHDWPTAEREAAHVEAAQLLDAAGAEAERIAAHLLLAAPAGRAWAVDRLHEAARRAGRRGAPEGGIAYLLRALDEPAPAQLRPQLLLELGIAEAMTSGPAAVEHLREAYATLADARQRALAAHILAQALIFTGAAAHAAALAREAAEALPEELADERLVLEAIEAATVYFGVDDPDVVRRLKRHRTREVGRGPGSKMVAAVTAFEWAFSGGGAAECAALALAALDGDELLAVDAGFVSIEAIAVLALADRAESVEQCDRLLADAHRRGSLFIVLGAELWKGHAMLRRGELSDAEALVRSAGDGLRLWGADPVATSYQQAFLSNVLLERGDVAGARQAVGVLGDGYADHRRMRCEVDLLLAEGDTEAALARSHDHEALSARVVNPIWAPWRSLRAIALDRLRRTGEALALVEDELRDARRWGAPGTVGRTLRILGTLARDDGIGRLEQAVGVLEGSTARLEHAKALAALGGALRLARRPTDAREPLRRALELADLCGASGLAAHVRTELHATGARPRTSALRGAASLTASERRVTGLAVDGLTNRDIAQRLFVTQKTVEVHLSSAFRKLGVRSRRSLEGALADS